MLSLSQVVVTAVSLVVTRLVYRRRWSLSPVLLSGLVYYEVEESSLISGGGSSAQERRRNTGRARRRSLRANTPERILQISLTPVAVTRWPLYQDYDRCIAMLAVTMVHGFSVLMLPFLFRKENVMVKPLAAFTILLSLFTLLKIEATSTYRNRWDPWILLMLFLVMGGASCKLLMSAPTWLFFFDMNDAAVDLESRLNSLLEEAHPNAGYRISVEFLRVVMSVLAGVIGCVFCSAVLRNTRSAVLMQASHSEMTVSLRCPVWFGLLHFLQDLFTAANCVLWVTPLVALFQMKLDRLRNLQAYCCLIAAGFQMMLFRPLVQGYLNSGLISWYDETQQAANEEESETSKRLVALRISKCSFFLCKVALQVLVPVMVLVPCGVLLIWSKSRNIAYIYSICGFIIWWTNMVSFFVSLVVLFAARAGLVTL